MKNINVKLILLILSTSFYSMMCFANNNLGEWKPQIVEKMYILPPKHLNKVLNNDFNRSLLALNLQNTDNNIKIKQKKINKLNLLLSFLLKKLQRILKCFINKYGTNCIDLFL
jgi:hypothetical protein